MVEYITYKGEKYPVRIAWSTISKVKLDMSEYEIIELMLWYGLRSGHIADNKELTLKREDVEFILDESLDQFISIRDEALKNINSSDDDKKKSL